MPQIIFRGYAIPTLSGHADHTYVENDNGDTYPCWGRNNGGTEICTGNGSQSFANCLANKNGNAGIIYGVTGVCHQTSNRILYPSRQYVSKAKGYRASVFFWATYGRWIWRELRKCAQPPSISTPKASMNTFDSHITDLYVNNNMNVTRSSSESELEIMLDTYLDQNSKGKFQKSVYEKYQEYHERFESLKSIFSHKSINNEEYVYKVNTLQKHTLIDIQNIIGEENFLKLFGSSIEENGGYIDLEIFMESNWQ